MSSLFKFDTKTNASLTPMRSSEAQLGSEASLWNALPPQRQGRSGDVSPVLSSSHWFRSQRIQFVRALILAGRHGSDRRSRKEAPQDEQPHSKVLLFKTKQQDIRRCLRFKMGTCVQCSESQSAGKELCFVWCTERTTCRRALLPVAIKLHKSSL